MYGKNITICFAVLMMVLVTICAGRSVKHNSEQATLTQKRAYFLANLLSKAAGQSNQVDRRDITDLFDFITDNRTEGDVESLAKIIADLVAVYEQDTNPQPVQPVQPVAQPKPATRDAHTRAAINDALIDVDDDIPDIDDFISAIIGRHKRSVK